MLEILPIFLSRIAQNFLPLFFCAYSHENSREVTLVLEIQVLE